MKTGETRNSSLSPGNKGGKNGESKAKTETETAEVTGLILLFGNGLDERCRYVPGVLARNGEAFVSTSLAITTNAPFQCSDRSIVLLINDDLVKSRILVFFVIPVKTGIQYLQYVT